ncbi:putative lipid II flippase FtsW [Candidatus Bipolaricaulota bacterium]|nr:putative lipid II flippase FtsW [Candidatus Bipolaricaulota bacterium]MBS3814230.1 putative lipid II flippase FtsW [Candidatus Bipolaricaulota bacterium]
MGEFNGQSSRLLSSSLLLTFFGLIMVYSSSWAYASHYYGNSYFLLLKQTIAAVIGFGALIFFIKVDLTKIIDLSGYLLAGFTFLTFLTLIPGLSTGGRWLDFGPLAFQPTEGLKFGLIIWASLGVADLGDKLKDFKRGIGPFLIVVGLLSLLTLLQPDFSMSVLLIASVGFLLFIGGARLLDLGKVIALGLPLLGGLLVLKPYRLQRLISFFGSGRDSMDTGYQLSQSLIAFGSGGIFGKGLGQSVEKFLYLPSGYNDFIYSIIGEELGFIGSLIVIGLFIAFGVEGFRIAVKQDDLVRSLIAAGFTFVICFQAILNFGVTLGLMPVTGLTLPFISYGGTSLIISLAIVGVLINIDNS